MLRSLVLWAEQAANDDTRAAIRELGYRPNADDIETTNADTPITLQRLWLLSLRYLVGSRRFINQNWLFVRGDSNRDNKYLTALYMLAWFSTGIAFQRGANWGMKSGSWLLGQIVAVPGMLIGGLIGGLLGTVSGVLDLFRSASDPFLVKVTTGARVGGNVGYNVGDWTGWLAGLVPGWLAGAAVGITAGLAVGAVSAVVWAAKFIETAIYVGSIVLNPYAWGRGFAYLQGKANDFRAYTGSTYNEELRSYNAPATITLDPLGTVVSRNARGEVVPNALPRTPSTPTPPPGVEPRSPTLTPIANAETAAAERERRTRHEGVAATGSTPSEGPPSTTSSSRSLRSRAARMMGYGS